MKTKIKRHYRSVVSVLLSVCMLVSCMTVGLIATDAAKVTDSEAVGASDTFTQYKTLFFKTDSSHWGADNARIKIWFYSDSDGYNCIEDQWMTRVSDDWYLVTVPYNNVKCVMFHRYSSDGNSDWSEGYWTKFKISDRTSDDQNIIKNSGDFNNIYWSSSDQVFEGDGSSNALWLWKAGQTSINNVSISGLNTENTFTVSETADYYWAYQINGKMYHIAGGGAGHISNSELNNYTVSNKEAKCYMNNQQDVKEDKNNFQTGSTYAIKVINAGDEKSTHQLYKVRPTATLDVGSITNATATVVQGENSLTVPSTGNTVYQSTDTTVTVTPADGYDLPEGAQISVGGSSYALTKSGGSYTATFQLSGDATGANGLTFPTPMQSVAESVSLTVSNSGGSSTSYLEVDNSSNALTLTAAATNPVSGEVTYTFYDESNTIVGSAQTSNNGTASVTTTQTAYQKTYHVVASQSGKASVTSNTVTVVNTDSDTAPTLLFGINGNLAKNSGTSSADWNCTYANSRKFTWVSGNTFRMEVTLTGDSNGKETDNSDNRFRLVKNDSDKQFAPDAGSNTPLFVYNSPTVKEAAKYYASTNLYFGAKFVDDSGTYYLYLDQSDLDKPLIWFTEKETGAYISDKGKAVVTDGIITNATKTGKIAGHLSGVGDTAILNYGEPIRSDYTFVLANNDDINAAGFDFYDNYTIDTAKNIGVSFTSEIVKVGSEDSEQDAQVFHIRSNSGGAYYTENVTLHFDHTNKKVYATATYDPTNGAGVGKAGSNGETIRYYFAEYDKQDTSSLNDCIEGGMRIEYWNNSLSGSVKLDPVYKASSSNYVSEIYVTMNSADQELGIVGGTGSTYESTPYWADDGTNNKFNLYYFDLPVWATTFAFIKADGAKVGTTCYALNPNRVYLMFNQDGQKISAIPLDDSIFSKDTHTNRPGTKTFKANAIKIDDSKLEAVYKELGTQNALYYGNYHDKNDGERYHWLRHNNLAQRINGNKFGNAAYNAITWGLTGGMLDTTDTTTNTNDGKYYAIMDSEYNSIEAFYNYSNVSTNNIASQKKMGTDFPFYKTTYNGITTYSYDSLCDPNRLLNSDGKTYNISDFIDVGDYNGFAPFGSSNKYAVASEFDISFYMTPSGYLEDNDYNSHDIMFNFSGDDDVWVYIDGVKVLDLGGDHMISAGTINLSDMKVYYKTPAKDTTKIKGTADSYAISENDMYTVDLNALFAAYGKSFSPTDATTKHKLQMFYMERGEGESNFSASFNLPQNSGLRVESALDTSNVNPAFVSDVQNVANNDYFSYSVAQTAASSEKDDAQTWWRTKKSDNTLTLHDAASSAMAVKSDPKFPANLAQDAIRGNGNVTLTEAGITGGTESAHNTLSGSSFNVNGLTYKLLDSYITNPVSPSGKIDADGKLNLLYGEAANFESKFTPHTALAIAQEDTIYNVSSAQMESKNYITKGTDSTRKVKEYYKTTYKVTDDSSDTVIGETTTPVFNAGNITAQGSGLTNKFYFTNYADSTDDNAAMTVQFTNQPATGTITITKAYTPLDVEANPHDLFTFKVEFSNVFGGSSAQAAYANLEYSVDGGATVKYGDGIKIKVGQTATITGVPVGTHYTVTEESSSRFKVVNSTVSETYATGIVKTNNDYAADIPSLTADHSDAYTAAYTYYNTKKTLDVQITKTVLSPYAAGVDYTVEDHSTDFGFRIYRKQPAALGDPENSFVEVTTALSYSPYNGTATSLSYDSSNQCYKIKYGDVATLVDMSPDDEFWIIETNQTGNWGNADDLNYYKYKQTVLTKIEDGASVSGEDVTKSPDDAITAPGKKFTIGQDGVRIDLQNEPEMKTVTVKKDTDFMEEGSLFNILIATNQHNGTGYKKNMLGTFTENDPEVQNNPSEHSVTVGATTTTYGQYKSLKDTEITFSIPVGTRFCVNELAPDNSPVTGAQRFTLRSTNSISYEYGSTPTTGYISAGGNIVISDATAFVVNNVIFKRDVTIQKVITNRGTGTVDTDSEHKVILRMKNNGPDDVYDYAGNTVASTRIATLSYTSNMYNTAEHDRDQSNLAYNYDSDSDGTNDCHSILLKENEVITIHNMPVGTYFEVYEVEVATSYTYDGTNNVTVSNQATEPERLIAVPDDHGIKFTTKDAVAAVLVNNKLDQIKYKIVYTFPSRPVLIGEHAGEPRYGDDLKYTVDGIASADCLESDHLKQSFVQSQTPYEKNFMQDMTWGYGSTTYNTETEEVTGDTIYTAAVTATHGSLPTKKVTFYFPYNSSEYPIHDYDGTKYRGKVFGPTDASPTKSYYTTKEYTEVTYQGNPAVFAKRKNADGEDYWEDFCTFAAEELSDGKKFLYWSIRAQNRNAVKDDTGNYPYEEVARCYESRFTYSIFDNYRVYAIYEGDVPAGSTSGKETDTYTYINFLDYSRNHWNNGDRGTDGISEYPSHQEGDIVWTDFDVSFENGYELIQANDNTEVGVLIEMVQDALDEGYALNPVANDYAEKYQHYVTKYTESEVTWKASAETFLLSDDKKNDTYSRQVINKSDLTNKGRSEYGYGLFVRTSNGVVQEVKKNALYRAYSYIKLKNNSTIILSKTPVYFCVKNEADK